LSVFTTRLKKPMAAASREVVLEAVDHKPADGGRSGFDIEAIRA